jgi:hypothetical protein
MAPGHASPSIGESVRSRQVLSSQRLVEEDKTIQELSLFGGPLQWLGCRLGLVRGTNTIRLGVALGWFSWGVAILLAVLQGHGSEMFSLTVIGGYVRFLVAVPLFFLCETTVFPQMAEFARYIVRSGLVSGASLPALASDIGRVSRMANSWLAEGLFLLAAYMIPILAKVAPLPGSTGSLVSMLHFAGGGHTWINSWYLGFCLPLFRFLMLRWLWRLSLWWYFLWRVQKLELRLIPTHSDAAAGLGYLELVHENFAPLAFAISALFSAQFAEDIFAGTMAFETLYSVIPMVILLILALIIGPLFIFSRKLWICRWTGLSAHMGMVSRYVNAFDSKWIQDPDKSGESQLGSPDVGGLASLSTSLAVVRGMQPIPAGLRLVKRIAACVILPLLPLLLLKYPEDQLAARLLKALIGI